ncbi:ATP-binding protein [Solitalea longa]|uniref:ATP-binding protein n=1 Tax=Solitalea longa TaxID=2079460 RepID=A0A2S5A3I8_9SPHI|nr:ATP-binding protein [Solitalea longa]POY37150.1 ATP-binding protein [Solitalea longa]
MGQITTDTSKLYTLQLASKLDSIVELENFLELLLEEHQVSNECYGNIMTSLNEAAMNAIVHGNKCLENRKVYINVEVVNKSKFIFTVADEGEGFDFRNLTDPTLPENIEKDSGRGVFIMKHLADRLIYNARGNEVEMHFNF